jgi:hypothetical protein
VRHSRAQYFHCPSAESLSVIEMLFRLGFALLLSVSLALLLAWGWFSSDERTVSAAAEMPPLVMPSTEVR